VNDRSTAAMVEIGVPDGVVVRQIPKHA
jgi:hypothetical protein